MADIATLGIEVTTKGVQQAEQDLARLAKAGAKVDGIPAATDKALSAAGVTWKQFIAERMGDYMRLEGGHSAAMKRIAAEWKDYKASISNGLGTQATRQVAAIGPAMARAAISAGQLKAATRGLPEQFTDIVTSLASGQRPLQVLLQQGGQLKDMFGGTGAAARALGGYIAGLVNPLTLTAAAAAGLALAWHEAEAETEAFNRALILTGNYAGTTAAQLDLMAARLDAGNTSYREAAEVIAKVAATGRFTTEQIEQVSLAALDAQAQLGIGVEETLKKFVALGRDPVDAILKLNETEHFLTQTVYEQIKSLEDQGRQMDAGGVAIAAYAKLTRERAAQMAGDVNHLTEAWRTLKRTIADIADLAIGVFRTGPSQQVKELQGNLDRLRKGEGLYAELSAATRARLAKQFEDKIKAIEQRGQAAAAATTKDKPVDSAAERARAEFEQAGLRYLDDRARKLKEIADVEKLVAARIIQRGEADKRIAQINAFYARKEPKGPKPKKPRALSDTDTGETLLGQIRQQIALNEQEAKTQDALTTSERLAITARQQLGKIIDTVTASRRKEIDAALAQLESSGKQAEAMKAEKKAAEDLARLKEQLAVGELNQRRSAEIDLLSIGRGREQVDQLRRQLDLQREYEDGLAEIRRNSKDKTAKALADEEAALKESLARRLVVESDYQRQRVAEMAKWQNGARSAIEDYLSSAADVAGQTSAIVGNAFSGLEDTLVDFFTKGKADFRSFFDAIAADITRFVVRQQLAKVAKGLLGKLGLGGDEGDQAAALSRSAGELTASGATLIGAAAALSTSAAALAAAGLASAGGGAGGAGSLGGFGNLIGSFLNLGRATGGDVSRGRLYEVGERNRPEMLYANGRQYLIPGNRGRVEPGVGMAGAGPSVLNQTFVIAGRVDNRTTEQMARTSGREAARGMARTGK